jgi:hypothetical protein
VSREQVFTLEATPLKYGRGAAGDAGWELASTPNGFIPHGQSVIVTAEILARLALSDHCARCARC